MSVKDKKAERNIRCSNYKTNESGTETENLSMTKKKRRGGNITHVLSRTRAADIGGKGGWSRSVGQEEMNVGVLESKLLPHKKEKERTRLYPDCKPYIEVAFLEIRSSRSLRGGVRCKRYRGAQNFRKLGTMDYRRRDVSSSSSVGKKLTLSNTKLREPRGMQLHRTRTLYATLPGNCKWRPETVIGKRFRVTAGI